MVLVMLVVLEALMVTTMVATMMSAVNDGHDRLHYLISRSMVTMVSVSVSVVLLMHHTSNQKGSCACHTSRCHAAGNMRSMVSWSCSIRLRRSTVSIGLRGVCCVWLTIGLRRGCTISIRLRWGWCCSIGRRLTIGGGSSIGTGLSIGAGSGTEAGHCRHTGDMGHVKALVLSHRGASWGRGGHCSRFGCRCSSVWWRRLGPRIIPLSLATRGFW